MSKTVHIDLPQHKSLDTKSQRGNQNPYIEEEQTTQWPKEKVRKDKQRSTNMHIKLKIE